MNSYAICVILFQAFEIGGMMLMHRLMELYGRQWKGDRVTLWLSKKYLMHFRMQQMHRFGKKLKK
jgi:hypothetical protein